MAKGLKKTFLALVTVGSGTGIVKVAVDSSLSGSVVPLSGNNNQNSFVLSAEDGEDLVRRRARRNAVERVVSDTAGLENLMQTDTPLVVNQENLPNVSREDWKEEEKIRVRAEAERVYKTLDDYTFKLFGPCVYGTGWILDYELAEKGKYPTTWYIATNAHVIANFRFPKNTYEQLLPFSAEGTQVRRQRERSEYWRNKHSEVALDDVRYSHCDSPEKYGYLDINISQGEKGVYRKADFGLFGQGKIEEPNLFFSAFNFMDTTKTGVHDNHFTDFAVLELKFKDEQEARNVTGGFADKYGVDSTDAINVFNKPLESKGREALNNLKDNIYILAYPADKSNKWEYTKNFDSKSAIASRLWGDGVSSEKKWRGFIDPKGVKVGKYKYQWWDGRQFTDLGHFYELGYNPLGVGSSGGMFVDKDLGIVGVTAVTTVGPVAFLSWSAPLRSDGVTFREYGETITTPKFDLIVGADNQLNSYKQQVEKYKKNTWLKARNWEHKYDRGGLDWF